MYILDLSAIDKLIDFYGENCTVLYKKNIYSLYQLKEYFIDNNLSCDLNTYDVYKNGIFFENAEIISVVDLRSNVKDDLIGL